MLRHYATAVVHLVEALRYGVVQLVEAMRYGVVQLVQSLRYGGGAVG